MKTMTRGLAMAALAVLLWGAAAAPARADDKELGFSDTAELSLVATDGNAESRSFGFNNKLRYQWEKALFQFNAAGVRIESEANDTVAFDPDPDDPDNPLQFIEPDLETSTEAYLLEVRYDRDISERFFWFGFTSWDRNRPAGINNRFILGGGVGNIWIDKEKVQFKTDYAVTYTDQENLIPPDQDFAGARGSWNYANKLTETTTYTNDLIVDFNLDDTEDWRANMLNAVQVAMTDKIALQVSLRFLYDNLPSFEDVTVFDGPNGTGTAIDTVSRELDELDTILSASVVVNF